MAFDYIKLPFCDKKVIPLALIMTIMLGRKVFTCLALDLLNHKRSKILSLLLSKTIFSQTKNLPLREREKKINKNLNTFVGCPNPLRVARPPRCGFTCGWATLKLCGGGSATFVVDFGSNRITLTICGATPIISFLGVAEPSPQIVGVVRPPPPLLHFE